MTINGKISKFAEFFFSKTIWQKGKKLHDSIPQYKEQIYGRSQFKFLLDELILTTTKLDYLYRIFIYTR